MILSTWRQIESWFQTSPKSSRRRGRRALELTPGCVNVLESRALLAVDLNGSWSINGLATSIQQSGTNLTFINERGEMAQGRLLTDTQLVADGWGGLRGNIVNGNTINWANNTVWTRQPTGQLPDLSGGWFINNQSTSISQSGTSLFFTNERGDTAQGRLVSSTQVIADGWGGLQGTIVYDSSGDPASIRWANNSVWNRTPNNPPSLPQAWTINGQRAFVNSDGNGGLIFTNEFGNRSSGYFLNSTQVVATEWGNLVGTLSSNSTVINWANNTRWTATATALARR